MQNVKLAFERHGDVYGIPRGIFSINPDGSDLYQLRTSGSVPAWSPDGHWIAFKDVHEGSDNGRGGIFIMRTNGAEARRLTFHAEGDVGQPRWSFDSKYIAYHLWIKEAYQVWVIDMTSGEYNRVTNADGVGYPAWTHNGNLVGLDRSDKPSPVVMFDRLGRKRQISKLFEPGDHEMMWFRDGTKIAFVRDGKIHILHSDRRPPQSFEAGKNGAMSLCWLPGGEHIAYSSGERDEAGTEIFVLDLKTGSSVRVVDNPKRPDGDQCVESLDLSCSPQLESGQFEQCTASFEGRRHEYAYNNLEAYSHLTAGKFCRLLSFVLAEGAKASRGESADDDHGKAKRVEALNHYLKILELEPGCTDPEVFFLIGERLAQGDGGAQTDAVPYLDNAVKFDAIHNTLDKNSKDYYMLWDMRVVMGLGAGERVEDVRRFAEQAVRCGKGDEERYNFHVQIAKGKSIESIAEEMTEESAPPPLPSGSQDSEADHNRNKDINDHYNLGVQACERELFDRAIQEFEYCLAKGPMDDFKLLVLHNLRYAIIKKYRFEERDGSSISDDEYQEVKKLRTLVVESIKTFEALDEDTVLHSKLNLHDIYKSAKSALDMWTLYGGTVRLKNGKLAFRRDSEKPETISKDAHGSRSPSARLGCSIAILSLVIASGYFYLLNK